MKIKCPLCGCKNYFTGLEDKGTKFCSNCNTPLDEPKNSGIIENSFIKIPDINFPRPEKILDKETFCNTLTDWVVAGLKIRRRNGIFKSFLKSIVEFGDDKVMEDKFYEEIIYFYMWLAYTNCVSVFQNKNKINGYFPHFTKKIYSLFSMFSKLEFGGYEEEEWERNLTKKINGYVDAYNLSIEEISHFSNLGKEFYKNLYGRESLAGATTIYIFTIFVTEELKASFESLGKVLSRYKI
jgi:hypothetical protein